MPRKKVKKNESKDCKEVKECDSIKYNDIPTMLLDMKSALETLTFKVAALEMQGCKDNDWLTIEQLQLRLPTHPSLDTIYRWVRKRQIPYHKPGNRLYFDPKEVREWIDNHKIEPQQSIQEQAEEYIKSHPRKK